MRTALARLTMLLASALIAALLLECGVVATLGEQPRFPRHVVGADFGVRVNEPGAHYRQRSADVDVAFRINARGLRDDRDFPYAKPEGVARIVSLGDSFTVGYEVEADETFSAVLEETLRAAGYRVEVLNAGVSGYSNAEALLYLERELLRYEPDVVLLSFYGNDLVDNVRTGLFRLEDGRLVATAERYVPAGSLGDFLNRNPLFNFLGARSNAFVLLKEKATLLAKRRMVSENEANLARAAPGAPGPGEAQARLAAALLDRLYAVTRQAGARLLLQSIPSPVPLAEPEELRELFPLDHFDPDREGLAFVAMAPLLEPHRRAGERLYHTRSHGHWTPLAHRLSGEALAERIIREGWLGPPPGAAAPGAGAAGPGAAAP